MPSSFPDQRSGRILLVAHRILSTTIAGVGRHDGASAVIAVTNWGAQHGAGLYQLPLPSYQLGRENPQRDIDRIQFVLGQLDIYRGSGYRILAAIAISEDLASDAEQRWWLRFTELAAVHGWEDLPLRQVSLDADEADMVPEMGATSGAQQLLVERDQ